jgi:hypothetical protein
VTGLQITQEFDEPYSQSQSALPSSFSPSVVGISGVPYLMDTSESRYRRESFDVVQQRNTTDARDLLLLPQDVWRQQVQSWHYGAGQSNRDRDDSLQFRFDQSYGIDPWTQWQLSLLPETERLRGTENLTGETWLTTYDQYLAVVNDESIYWFDALSAGSAAVGSTVVSTGHSVVDIANDGHLVTTLMDNGYIFTTAGPAATPVQYYNQALTNANFIAWEKDYLLCGRTNVLEWVKTGNQKTTIYTHPDTAFRWYSAAAGNSCIYVLGRLGERTVIHRVNIKSDGTGLNPCIVAATLPDGEVGYTIESYLGFILIGTAEGVRVAQPNNEAGDLTLGPIIPTNEPVRCFEGHDRFVWYGNSAVDSTYSTLTDTDIFPVGTVCGLGRMDLSVTTVNQLTPAYASDIVVASESNKVVRSVLTYLNRRVFSIDGGGVWYNTDNKMPGGWIKQGTVSYSVEDLKTGLYMQGKWIPQCVSEIGFDLAYDSSTYVRIATISTNTGVRSGNISLDGTQFSRVDSRMVLYRCPLDTTKTPLFTRWEIRSIPVKGKASRWTLPIINAEEVEIDGVKYARNPLTTLDALIGLVESSRLFVLQEAGRAYQVHAKEFLWQPEKLTADGRAWQGLFTLVVEEVQ